LTPINYSKKPKEESGRGKGTRSEGNRHTRAQLRRRAAGLQEKKNRGGKGIGKFEIQRKVRNATIRNLHI